MVRDGQVVGRGGVRTWSGGVGSRDGGGILPLLWWWPHATRRRWLMNNIVLRVEKVSRVPLDPLAVTLTVHRPL